ncbi:hypothetical protein WJX84_008004 [Apatococcus fuscideae]|uniref:DNA-directed RNA polymerases I, II, and III subunit RPABC3 n=1 Tax=Apatococcus fuscideae TaxID=2026836 RepID=A0AAW1T1K3_9CHLO
MQTKQPKAAKTLVNDVFEVKEKDPDGKKFDKVSRIICHSDLYEFVMTLDINIDIYPVEVGDKLATVLTTGISGDGTTSGSYDKTLQQPGKGTSQMDQYEYVMHGKVFKYKDVEKGNQSHVEVLISFGGLLLQLIGEPSRLSEFEVDMNLFLLMRKS